MEVPLNPTQKHKRDWRLKTASNVWTCHQCDRSIVPGETFYQDAITYHIVLHYDCHQLAEARG